MDEQLKQQLIQAVQNMLQILQSSGGAAGAAGAVPPAGGSDGTEGYDDDSGMESGGAAGGMEDDDDMGDDADMSDSAPPAGGNGAPPPAGGQAPPNGANPQQSGAGSLHDRIGRLESHTGLKKSASNLSFSQRLDLLEEDLLGEAYEGPTVARVEQLEKAAYSSVATEEDVPESIDLGDLIKTAIDTAKKEFTAELDQRLGKSATQELPSPEQLRGQARYGTRKAVVPENSADADLIKSARSWGFDDDLDAQVSFGDALRMSYLAQGGAAIPYDDDEEDE
jgi:hypothetical protein